MINHLVLVVDVGGTNTRFSLAERNSLIKASSARFLNADFGTVRVNLLEAGRANL